MTYVSGRSTGVKLPTMLFPLYKNKRRYLQRLNSALAILGKKAKGGSRRVFLPRSGLKQKQGVYLPGNSNYGYRLLSAHKNSYARSLLKKIRMMRASRWGKLYRLQRRDTPFKHKRNPLSSTLATPTLHRAPRALQSAYFSYERRTTGISKLGKLWQSANSDNTYPSILTGRFSSFEGDKDAFFKQPLVRYKPGLLRYWRAHRFFFRKYFFLVALNRQRRFTQYISKLSGICSFSFFRAMELSVLHVIFTSKLLNSTCLGQA